MIHDDGNFENCVRCAVRGGSPAAACETMEEHKKIREMLHGTGSPRLLASGTFGSKDIIEVRSLVNDNKKEKNADQDESPLVEEYENEKSFAQSPPFPCYILKRLVNPKDDDFFGSCKVPCAGSCWNLVSFSTPKCVLILSSRYQGHVERQCYSQEEDGRTVKLPDEKRPTRE